ncbi:xanthine dehydrogenase family protein molybdopterin-binding subunit [Sphingomonas ginsenosidivorax]|uniref:Xanthine dehydrogenase family protein molybdopterin-binding subunit n=1 Tax=Sphingomonas ginsenosidivorax TaxID=862135 RepID=A0A5C6UHX8_9SPHN|nr:molybdopterin cofactor-binding domain-containing protein [Sphingomonas ginsenosidivorax]TXC71821.1 xanthine dehydrogenase family protein molybdopterin-binding subunit [Sphingomonas ginsenosidivorax]
MANGINRRRLLVGGGAGVGLLVAWGLWPRSYAPNLVANPGEALFGAWLKIGTDGHVTVAVPQAEHGQGVYTALAQIVADELGADWRTVGVEPAPLNPLYANPLGVNDLFEGLFSALPADAPILTGGSSSIRMFETACREAGAAARALLCRAAAERWDVDWTQTRVEAGFVVHGAKRLRFAELAEVAAGGTIPDPLPLGMHGAGKLVGTSVPRIDAPSKVDGSANFAGDVRLADMVHAAIRQGPAGSRLTRVDRAAADRIRGVLSVVENPRWVAAVATTWWAAQQALDALAPRFEGGRAVDSASIDTALTTALGQPGTRMAKVGDVDGVFEGARLVTAEYRVGLGLHAGLETPSATAAFRDGRLELWLATQAPGLARAAAARAAGLSDSAVTVHPMLVGGSFGAALEHHVAEQAAVLAMTLKRPVALVWSRGEDSLHDRYRPAARARMAARLAPNGAILGWSAKIAAPSTGAELARRLMPGLATEAAVRVARGDRHAVAGAMPAYRMPAVAIDHHAADIGVATGHVRGGAHVSSAFFTECFLDELAKLGHSEPMSFRIGMLGGNPRLARCLSTAASLGGWDGGVPGSGQGIACHAFRGSYIAVLAEAHMGDDRRPVVDRLVAAVDCGAQINPDLVRQQIEGGLIFGMANALGAATGFTRGLADVRGFDTMRIPRLADTPDITVELIRSDEAPGGVGELGVPAVAPAIANALQSATGYRIRDLPLNTMA